VQFITAPNVPYPMDPNQVEFAQPDADNVFAALAYDRTLPKISAAKPGKAATTVRTVSPSQVKVMVYNGTTAPTLAGDTATKLTSRGFVVVGIADTATPTWTGTVIEYGSDADLPAVNTLRGQFSAAVTARLVPTVSPGTIQLILGVTGHYLLPVPSPGASSPASSVSGLAQQYNGITGNVRCRDGAFFGPNLPSPAAASPSATPSVATASGTPSASSAGGSATAAGASSGAAGCAC
jgi:LytR cell envelope-related transcriptional attenuator